MRDDTAGRGNAARIRVAVAKLVIHVSWDQEYFVVDFSFSPFINNLLDRIVGPLEDFTTMG